MPKYQIADLLMEIHPRYTLLEEKLAPYLVQTEEAPLFSVSCTEEEILAAQSQNEGSSLAYAEQFAVFQRVCTFACGYGVIPFHAATVKVDGRAYAFSAPSGTGKSTHIRLWRKHFGDRVGIINGDKPFLRENGGVLTVYGSPWCGKEGWSANTSAALAGICFLKQAKENTITRLTAAAALPMVLPQLLKPKSEDAVNQSMRLLDKLLREVPIYQMECNISEEAAELSFQTMVESHL